VEPTSIAKQMSSEVKLKSSALFLLFMCFFSFTIIYYVIGRAGHIRKSAFLRSHGKSAEKAMAFCLF